MVISKQKIKDIILSEYLRNHDCPRVIVKYAYLKQYPINGSKETEYQIDKLLIEIAEDLGIPKDHLFRGVY